MKLYVLFGQREEAYQNQLAPEALAVADEFTHNDNPDYLKGEYTLYEDSNEFTGLGIVEIETGADGFKEIKNRLCGNHPEVKGEVV